MAQVRALQVSRKLTRFAAARLAGNWQPGAGAKVGPLKLKQVSELDLPTKEWVRVQPLLSGICGSDLSTVDGNSSRYFEPIVSFPFTPGHEVVGTDSRGNRVVIEPVLGCTVRGNSHLDTSCAAGHHDRCEHLHTGTIAPGLQTGYCADTGGGWSDELVAHPSQIHAIPDEMDDETAVMVEPTACAVHAVGGTPAGLGTIAVLGAGTLGLLCAAAIRHYAAPCRLLIGARHPIQQRFSKEWADTVVDGDGLLRAVRRATGSFSYGDRMLAGGADVVVNCVGNSASIAESIAMCRPGGTVLLVGMPSQVSFDMTALWHKQIRLTGCYAYGVEEALGGRRTFDVAFELAVSAKVGRMVSARYPLERFTDAIDHAANAGRRGAVKVVFEPRRKDR